MAHPIFTEEHDLIRSQLRRFVDEKVRPHGPKWEEAGFVPRAVLREMGELGFFSLRDLTIETPSAGSWNR